MPQGEGKEPDGLKRESDIPEETGRKKFKPEESSSEKPTVSFEIFHNGTSF